MTTRRAIAVGAIAASIALQSYAAQAQPSWPQQPISINIGNAPGGDDDTLSRWLAETMRAELGQPVIVENRVGASTTIGATAVAGADPDGYTLFCMIAPTVIQTALRDDLRYDMDSFEPIVRIGGYPLALIASRTSGLEDFDDLVTAAQGGDGVTFASGGVGTVGHLTGTMFLSEIEGNGVHVSFRNNPEGLQSLMGGFTQMTFASAREATALRDDPNLVILAVTSEERVEGLPDVPTMSELGYPDINARVWYGYVAPAGTDPAIVDRIAASIVAGVNSDAFQNQFRPLSFQTEIAEGEAFGTFLREEQARFSRMIEEEGISLQN